MLARSFDESNTPFLPAPAASTAAAVDAEVFPHHPDRIPPGVVQAGSYDLRYAWTRADLHAVQRLRYRVFTEELGNGTSASVDEPGERRDEDARDPWFHHLMIVHRESGAVVGTYRLQTAVMAATRFGFYSATLFELGAMPASVLQQAVEIGRAAVDPQHRSGRVLHLLWRGLARYLSWNSKRFLFGCCSIQGVDDRVAQDTWRVLHARQVLHDRILVRPRPAVRALADDGRTRPLIDATALTASLPSLFDGYLSLGARVCGAPAFDREFGTTDFLVLLDIDEMPARAAKTLFG
ncbi:MAG: GNAT family N-acetyltransferase [Gemmatimonadaceae bacterium]|nr:GNAT family N-acetyltransferase [Gemmatimonadaceae bacterium]